MNKEISSNQNASADEEMDRISDFIIEKIVENEKTTKVVAGHITIQFPLKHEVLKELILEKFGEGIAPLMFVYSKLEKEQIINSDDIISLTGVGKEIIAKYSTYLNYRKHLKESVDKMKPIEYCLDAILRKLEENWTNPKNGSIEWLNATELLDEFNLPGRHEFLKGLIRKLHEDGYVEYKDGVLEESNATPIDFFRSKTLITVKGYYFIKNENGYTGEMQRVNESKERETRILSRQIQLQENADSLQSRMVILTRWVAAGAISSILYYIIEIWKSIQKMNESHHWY